MSRARWVAVLAWAAVILVATSLPGRLVPPAFPYADKLVHLAAYAVLGGLVARALRAGRPGSPGARTLVGAAAAVALFAAGDEWHQQFIPGRSGDPTDWLADLIGASAGLAVLATTPSHSEQRI